MWFGNMTIYQGVLIVNILPVCYGYWILLDLWGKWINRKHNEGTDNEDDTKYNTNCNDAFQLFLWSFG
jgi:hypothetical protein